MKKNPPVAVFANPGRKKSGGISERGAWHKVQQACSRLRTMTALSMDQRALVQDIENVTNAMIQQLALGIHANPASIPLLGRDRNRIGGERMSNRVLAVEYQHQEDGKEYRHDFRPGVQMIAEADGNIRLQHSKPGHSLWEDM